MESFNSVKYRIIPAGELGNTVFSCGENVSVSVAINENGLKGWVKGVIEKNKGEFYLVRIFSEENSFEDENVRIFHKTEIRKQE